MVTRILFGIKCYFALVWLLLIADVTMAQGTEEQRKYDVPDPVAFTAFILSSGSAGEFSTVHHSDYTYMDIYLDTPDEQLFRHGLSLRFRKRILGDTLVTYGLQLKNEMAADTAIRMEVEEPELDFYQLKTAEGWQPLTATLDVYFNALSEGAVDADDPEIAAASAQLQEWIRFKAGSVVTPFRKLLNLHLEGIDLAAVQSLRPVICGIEKRRRSHIYCDPATAAVRLKDLPRNAVATSSLPRFFRENPGFNWLLESSLDSAVFYPLFDSHIPSVTIFEYETENKYSTRATGTQLLFRFEQELRTRFALRPRSDSKYRTSMRAFRGQ